MTGPTLVWERVIGRVRESSPTLVEVDGQVNVTVGSLDHQLYVVRAGDGSNAPGWPQRTSSPINGPASVADTDGDSRPEIFTGSGEDVNQGGGLYSYTADGRVRFRFQPTDVINGDLSVSTAPALGDTTGDGVPDVAVAPLGLRMWNLDESGRVHAGWPMDTDDTVHSSPAFSFCDAGFFGSAVALSLNKPIVGMAPTARREAVTPAVGPVAGARDRTGVEAIARNWAGDDPTHSWLPRRGHSPSQETT